MDLSKYEVSSLTTCLESTPLFLTRYDSAFQEHKLSTLDILRYRAGVCREFVKIFAELCQIAGVQVQSIQGYARGPDYRPGKEDSSC